MSNTRTVLDKNGWPALQVTASAPIDHELSAEELAFLEAKTRAALSKWAEKNADDFTRDLLQGAGVESEAAGLLS